MNQDVIINSFTSYSLTPEATLQGHILTDLQRKVLQNLLAVASEERLALEYDVANPMSFVQAEAGLKGQIATYRYLLDMSESALAATYSVDSE